MPWPRARERYGRRENAMGWMGWLGATRCLKLLLLFFAKPGRRATSVLRTPRTARISQYVYAVANDGEAICAERHRHYSSSTAPSISFSTPQPLSPSAQFLRHGDRSPLLPPAAESACIPPTTVPPRTARCVSNHTCPSYPTSATAEARWDGQ